MPSIHQEFKAALSYLDKFQFHGFRLGLERMICILNALGNPEKKYPCLHVAGSNGKGSVCAIAASILSAAGYRVGLYTSPHLSSPGERFKIGTAIISKKELKDQINKIRHFLEKGYELSYFEFTTAIAMNWFAEQKIDLAVLETGLGGRLDATNIVTPLVSVITNISLEHQSFLGNTIQKIATEKAGIIKKGVLLVTGVREQSALSVILDRCMKLNAPVQMLGRDFDIKEGNDSLINYKSKTLKISGLELALQGTHQVSNAGLAIAACEGLINKGFKITPAAFITGCRDVFWPGRGECLCGICRVLLDGAHNMDGVRMFKDLLVRLKTGLEKNVKCRKVLLWACSDEGGDKDFVSMLGHIESMFEQILITEPPGPRSPVTIKQWRMNDLPSYLILKKNWKQALNKALSSCGPQDLLCVTGSLYLVGAVREELIKKKFVRCD